MYVYLALAGTCWWSDHLEPSYSYLITPYRPATNNLLPKKAWAKQNDCWSTNGNMTRSSKNILQHHLNGFSLSPSKVNQISISKNQQFRDFSPEIAGKQVGLFMVHSFSKDGILNNCGLILRSTFLVDQRYPKRINIILQREQAPSSGEGAWPRIQFDSLEGLQPDRWLGGCWAGFTQPNKTTT